MREPFSVACRGCVADPAFVLQNNREELDRSLVVTKGHHPFGNGQETLHGAFHPCPPFISPLDHNSNLEIHVLLQQIVDFQDPAQLGDPIAIDAAPRRRTIFFWRCVRKAIVHMQACVLPVSADRVHSVRVLARTVESRSAN